MEGNILTNKSAIDRPTTDFYPTPENVTIALIDFLKLEKGTKVWECACGEGHISKVLIENGCEVVSSDLNITGYGHNGIDFTKTINHHKDVKWIITNPPFNVSEEFIKKCIEHKLKFALLLKSQYWHSKKRIKLFEDFKPEYVLPLTWRPDFLFGKKGGSPTMDCIWVVWDNKPSDYTIYEPLQKPL